MQRDRKMFSHHRNGKKFDKFGNNRFQRRNNDAGEGPSSHSPGDGGKKLKHPSHLRGRAIGLYYAQMNKIRHALQENQLPKPLGTILLSESKKHHITQLLESGTSRQLKENNGTYDNLADSRFKRNFIDIVCGSIQDKLTDTVNIRRSYDLDDKLYEQHQERQSDSGFKAMLAKRKKLPSYDMKDEIIGLIERNQVCVISGETGCGKTTQVAQFILDDYIEKKKGSLCKVMCSQPRRISAISVAQRVADERSETLGHSVGYQIRLERKMPREKGSIVFCTTGVILKQMESDPSLSTVSHLILDEIHERDIMSDFIISLIKQVIKYRKDMKLILMSATLNAYQFAQYYGNCELIHIPGFTYHVEEYFLEDVLQRTKFDFEEFHSQRPAFHNFKHMEKIKRAKSEYSEFIEPHVRQLEAENKYSRHVCIQLRNPKCEELNMDLLFALLVNICTTEEDRGAILIFLTGYAEISNLNQLIQKSSKFPSSRYLILPLHSQMPTVDQRQIFETPPNGMRKIILSTNIAETSITIDDVVFVIDCGRIKLKNYDIETNCQMLLSQWEALANAQQRRGRAGRVKPGVCFYLFSRARHMTLEKYQKPEILRTRLEDVILTIKALQLGKAEEFLNTLLDKPDPKAVKVSIELLKRLNALDEFETLTPLGYHLAKLPMGPQVGKMILLGAIFSCLNPILSVAVSLDFKDAFQLPLGKEREADNRKYHLSRGTKSDHILFHEALEGFERAGHNSRSYCYTNFLSYHTLTLLQNMKKQFMEYLYEMEFVPERDPKCSACNRNSNNLSLVKAIICAGLYPNVAVGKKLMKHSKIFYTVNRERLELHRKSILCREMHFDSPLIVYYLRLKSSSDFVHDATMVHPLPLIFFGDKYTEHQENEFNSIMVNGRLRFKCSGSTSGIITELREWLSLFLEYKVSHPGFVDWKHNESHEVKVLRAIMELISSEDSGDIDVDAYDDA